MMKPLRPCPVFAARTFWTPGESRAAACPACMMQLEDVLSHNNDPVRVKHPVEIYAESLK